MDFKLAYAHALFLELHSRSKGSSCASSSLSLSLSSSRCMYTTMRCLLLIALPSAIVPLVEDDKACLWLLSASPVTDEEILW